MMPCSSKRVAISEISPYLKHVLIRSTVNQLNYYVILFLFNETDFQDILILLSAAYHILVSFNIDKRCALK